MSALGESECLNSLWGGDLCLQPPTVDSYTKATSQSLNLALSGGIGFSTNSRSVFFFSHKKNYSYVPLNF